MRGSDTFREASVGYASWRIRRDFLMEVWKLHRAASNDREALGVWCSARLGGGPIQRCGVGQKARKLNVAEGWRT